MSQYDSKKYFEKIGADCDALLKSGKVAEVTHIIAQLNFAKVHREARETLAKICRRSGLIHQGLRLLYPVVRDEKPSGPEASPSEVSEYAVLLSRNGSIHEALALLAHVPVEKAPEALLYQGFCHISNWNNIEAVGYFENYLKLDVDAYSKLICRVNLASSYIAIEEYEKAKLILLECVKTAHETGASRLFGNAWMLLGQVHFHLDDFARSREYLSQAAEIFNNNMSYDHLLIQKWLAVMSAIETNSLRPLKEFKTLALKQQHWESVREADLFSLKIDFRQAAFDSLFFGSPMEGYRARIHQQIKGTPSPFFLRGQKKSQILDLESGVISGDKKLNAGKKIHQVLFALNRDFYVPKNSGALFSELYPNEYFDVNSSPLRIRQLITRTRNWLRENQLEANISQLSGGYQFLIEGSFAVRIPLIQEQLSLHQILTQKLLRYYSRDRNFTTTEGCALLNISRSSFHRYLREAMAKGEIQKVSGSFHFRIV